MNCEEARDRLSAFFDNELPPDTQAMVSRHLESCKPCADQVDSLAELSDLAANLAPLKPPPELWMNLERQLDANPAVLRHPFAPGGILSGWAPVAALAAAILVAASLTIYMKTTSGHDHDELAADFSQYLDAFQLNAENAHLVLVSKYSGQTLDLQHARRELGYRPALADGLPEGFTLKTSYVLEMPCCKCVKCVCQTPDGRTIAIFEHDETQPVWFGNRVSFPAECVGQECDVTQLDGQIAIAWKHGTRHMTIVGARDVEDATQLIDHFVTQASRTAEQAG